MLRETTTGCEGAHKSGAEKWMMGRKDPSGGDRQGGDVQMKGGNKCRERLNL